MKNKDIQKIIKRDLSSTMPNVLPNIDLEKIVIKEPEKRTFPNPFRSPRLVFASILGFLLVLGILLTRGGDIIDSPSTIVFNEKEEIYAVSAISAVSLLHQTIESPNNQIFSGVRQAFLSTNRISSETWLIDSHIETLNRYLNAVEPILNHRDQLTFTVETSELDDFEYKLIFISLDLRNETVEQVIHYNQTIDGNEITLEGIMLVDGKTYVMMAEIDIEDDEFELELTAYQRGNEDNSIYVYQEIKANQQTFEYELIRFGETLFESSLEIFIKEDYVIIELEYESLYEEVTFEIKRVQYGAYDVLYIEYEIESEFYDEEGFIVVEVYFDEDSEEYIYRYTITIDDVTYTYDKNRKAITNTRFYFEDQLDFIHLYTVEIIDYYIENGTGLFARTLSLEDGFSYERSLPILYNNQLEFIIIKYSLIEDDDQYEFVGQAEINGLIYLAEGTLEYEDNHYELDVVFYDSADDTNYFELYEAYEDDYTLVYSLVVEGDERFIVEIVMDDNQVSLEVDNGLSFTQEVSFINLDDMIFSGVYEIESDVIDEEGIIEIHYSYDELTESYYYHYNVTVKNIKQSYIINED